jgi:hypothetical protein
VNEGTNHFQSGDVPLIWFVAIRSCIPTVENPETHGIPYRFVDKNGAISTFAGQKPQSKTEIIF